MDYGKLISGNLQYAPNIAVYEDGTQQIPPATSWLVDNGYKPIEYTPMPEPEEGFYYVAGWEETDTQIVQTWAKEELPEPEPDPIEEILETLDFILENMN